MKSDFEALTHSKKQEIEQLKKELGNKTLELYSSYQIRIDALLNEIEAANHQKEEQKNEH